MMVGDERPLDRLGLYWRQASNVDGCILLSCVIILRNPSSLRYSHWNIQ